MGPNTNDREIMRQLALNGMDVARFNFSHGDHGEHKKRFRAFETALQRDLKDRAASCRPEIRFILERDEGL